jgi:hypothetical protein
MLEGAEGEVSARVLPTQLCDALLFHHHQHQHCRGQQLHHRSHHQLVRILALWSVVLDWIHVTPPGSVVNAAAATSTSWSFALSGSARAPIIKWLGDAGLVQQMLAFISLSPLVSSDSGSGSRLVDAIDGALPTPISLLELAHAQPQQARARYTHLRRLHYYSVQHNTRT